MKTYKQSLILSVVSTAQAVRMTHEDNYFAVAGRQLAGLGEHCSGFNESIADKFPACQADLVCLDTGFPSIPGMGRTCQRPLAGLNQSCGGFNERTGQPYPDCEEGLVCSGLGNDWVSIPGAGNICKERAGFFQRCDSIECEYGLECRAIRWFGSICLRQTLARLGQTCEGYNEITGKPFPQCQRGLQCLDGGQPSIPGAGNTCQIPEKRARLGQNCGGFNESTGLPFPDCEEGLVCSSIGNDWVSIPGAGNICIIDFTSNAFQF